MPNSAQELKAEFQRRCILRADVRFSVDCRVVEA